MLQHPTQNSGITAVHSVQNSDSGVASLRFPSHPRVFAYEAKGSSESLRCLSLRPARYPFAARVTPSLLFGELRPSLIALTVLRGSCFEVLRGCPLRPKAVGS